MVVWAILFVRGTAWSQAEVQSLLQRGSGAMQHGDLPGAERAFREATHVAPRSAEAAMGLGLVQLREGSAEDAVASLSKAAALGPQLGGVHLFLGIAQYQLGRAADAIASLRAELAMSPDNVEAATWLTIALLGTDRSAEAVPVVDHAVALKPADPDLLYLQAKAHGAVVKGALAQLYALDPDSALVHRATAESLDGSGETEKAIAEYQAALRKQPGSPDLLEALGDEEQKGGHVEAAAAAFEQELKANPNSPVALYDLGRLDVERGKPAEGIVLLRRAQAGHAGSAATEFYLGLGLAETGQNEEAAHWLQASLVHDPPAFVQQGAWYQLARVYGKLNRKGEQQDALAHLKTVLEAQNRNKEATARAARAQTPAANATQAGQP